MHIIICLYAVLDTCFITDKQTMKMLGLKKLTMLISSQNLTVE